MSEVYEFIDAEYATSGAAPAITLMCRWLEVSKSGYYEWRSRPESATAKRREELKLLITKAFDDSDGTYGYRRVWWQLARWGVRAGPELVRARLTPPFERLAWNAFPSRSSSRVTIARISWSAAWKA